MRLIDTDFPVSARPAAPRRAALHRLLDDALRYAPEFAPKLANHMPMALAALDALGATPEQMQRFFDREAPEHVAVDVAFPAAGIVDVDDWTTLRGRYDAWPSLDAHFAARLARDGREAVLREAVPRLMPGLGGVAFHGVIRTAHAVESGHDGELAAALAYWASRWTILPPPKAPTADTPIFATPADWLDALDARLLADERDWRAAGRLVSDRMPQAVDTRAYAALGGATHGFRGALPERLLNLARAAAARYTVTRNFTVLHMATSARALRVLGPWLDADEPLPPSVWHAIAAASLSSGATWMPPIDPKRDDTGWDALLARARAHENDHAIKFVHAMWDQDAHAPSPVWIAAARVALRD